MKLRRSQIDGLNLIGVGAAAGGLMSITPGIGQVILFIDAVALVILGINQARQKE